MGSNALLAASLKRSADTNRGTGGARITRIPPV